MQKNCCNQPTVTYEILCATYCTNQIAFPIAHMKIISKVAYFLENDSSYYVAGNKFIRWFLEANGSIIHDFGWKRTTVVSPELANGSTYNRFNLGVNFVAIANFINSLPHTSVQPNVEYGLYFQIMDSSFHASNNYSNKFTFYIP